MSDRVKELLQQAIELIEEQELHIAAEMLPAGRILVEEIKAALSQQADPECRCTMRQQMVGDGCAVCNPEYAADHESEPAGAQDERGAEGWQLVPVEPTQAMISAGWKVGLMGMDQEGPQAVYRAMLAAAAPIARPEQQPVSWQFYQCGKWWNGDDRIKDHRKNTEAAGIPVRDLYAAPIAQTERHAPSARERVRNIEAHTDLMCIGDLCTEEGPLPATRMMPQSSDGGLTYEMEPCCDNHAAGWWDGADWDGRHLEVPIVEGVKNRS